MIERVLTLEVVLKITKRFDFIFEALFSSKRDYIGSDYRVEDTKTYGGGQNLTPNQINSTYNQTKDIPYIYASNYLYDKPVSYYYVPLSVGFDFETGGHVFQLILSNSRALAQTALLNGADFDYFKKEFVVGFNIHRYFSLAEKVDFEDMN